MMKKVFIDTMGCQMNKSDFHLAKRYDFASEEIKNHADGK